MHDQPQDDLPADQRTEWDFAAVDAARNPQSFVRYLQHQEDNQSAIFRRQLSYDLLEVHPGQHLLDVGCGLGDDVRALAQRVGQSGSITGLDNSERLLEAAHGIPENANLPISFVHGDMHYLPFDDAIFDSVRCERVLIHSTDPDQVVGEMLRVARPSGLIVITEPDLDSLVFHARQRAVVRKLTEWHSDRVRNGTIGRQLPAIFQRQGLKEIYESSRQSHRVRSCRITRVR
jgi:ubiquinone/menaquinone biosynthesis C-methylase UbiE